MFKDFLTGRAPDSAASVYQGDADQFRVRAKERAEPLFRVPGGKGPSQAAPDDLVLRQAPGRAETLGEEGVDLPAQLLGVGVEVVDALLQEDSFPPR